MHILTSLWSCQQATPSTTQQVVDHITLHTSEHAAKQAHMPLLATAGDAKHVVVDNVLSGICV